MPPDKEERPATSADVQAILSELGRLRAEMAALQGPAPPPASGHPAVVPRATSPPAEQLVTLDQVGAMVHRSKRSMERYRKQMPPPRVQGRRGRPHLWSWAEIRPWLEDTFGLRLPPQFPGHAY